MPTEGGAFFDDDVDPRDRARVAFTQRHRGERFRSAGDDAPDDADLFGQACAAVRLTAADMCEQFDAAGRRYPHVTAEGDQRRPSPRDRIGRPVQACEFAVAYAYLRNVYEVAARAARYERCSYGLKHEAERAFYTYIPNGALLLAADAAGFVVRPGRSVNWDVYVRPRHGWAPASAGPVTDGARAGNPRAISPRLRAFILERDAFRCRRCGWGAPDVRLVVDHITPVALGGHAHPDNLGALCEVCNQGKGARPPQPHDLRPRGV